MTLFGEHWWQILVLLGACCLAVVAVVVALAWFDSEWWEDLKRTVSGV